MKDNLKLVTVAVVDFSSQAEVIRTILEDAGISCYIKDNTVGNFMSVLTGGIKIQVESADEYMPLRMSQELGKSITKTTFSFTVGPDAFLVVDFNDPDDAELERQSQEQ